MLEDELRPMGFSGHPMPVSLKISVAFNFYASGSFQGFTADMCGVSQTAAHHCIKEVTNALFKRAGDYVRYRTDPDSQAQRTIGFGPSLDSPRCKVPMAQPAALINRKSFHSINGWILRDKTWLLRNPCTAAEERYNICHSSTQVTIEQAIGLLKMRVCCLDQSGGALQYAPARVSCIVVVCCALHNLALQRGEALHKEDMNDCHSSTDEEDTEENDEQAALDVELLATESSNIE
ncbi:putative nuclease HARBI1 [Heterodontus francisci]|uniref:putative nuclease HARBI1 n=1 Tax=Heterodontus francisci TaxID=7792 RepID=UPI00355B53C4